MRIKSIVALGFAGAAVAAVVVGGAAYASDGTSTDPQVIVNEYGEYGEGATGATGGTGAAAREDCPEKSGGQGESGEGRGSQGDSGGATGEQPAEETL